MNNCNSSSSPTAKVSGPMQKGAGEPFLTSSLDTVEEVAETSTATDGDNDDSVVVTMHSRTTSTTSTTTRLLLAEGTMEHHHHLRGDCIDNGERGDDNDEEEGDHDDNQTNRRRQGSIASARFNILSTMVGGGCLSLPLAFQKTGNGLLAPVLLLTVAGITEFCFRILIQSARTLSPVSQDHTLRGNDSFEAIATAAFGPKAYILSTGLVTAMCFFGTVGYAVLLRDMLQPIADLFTSPPYSSGPTLVNNLTMWSVVLLVTPVCTLQTLTSLQRFGAASMLSVLILGCCIVYRSLQCHFQSDNNTAANTIADTSVWDGFQLWPDSWRDVLNVFPLYISCYVCHYNILTVHNELRQPSRRRVNTWLRTTTWSATLFYLIIGMAGSAYAPCSSPTPNMIHGNILLDFNDNDPLLLVGRMCLAITITLAFPMLTIPARDILMRSFPNIFLSTTAHANTTTTTSTEDNARPPVESNNDLTEPLLSAQENGETIQQQHNNTDHSASVVLTSTVWQRLVASIIVFWSAATVASTVESIDVVWDLLGSSLSILLSHLIPCGSYWLIMRDHVQTRRDAVSRFVAGAMVAVFAPMMVVSTANAIYNTFFATA